MATNIPAPETNDWTEAPYKSVVDAVVAEARRTAVASRFLPPYGPLSNGDKPVPSEIITIDNQNKTLLINLSETTPIVEVGLRLR
jgi:hypothetical protein